MAGDGEYRKFFEEAAQRAGYKLVNKIGEWEPVFGNETSKGFTVFSPGKARAWVDDNTEDLGDEEMRERALNELAGMIKTAACYNWS